MPILKFYHIDRRLSLKSSDDLQIVLIIKKTKKLFPKKKKNRLPITKDILEKITKEELLKMDDLNMDIKFKFALVSFMRMGVLTYITAKLKKDTFKDTKLTRSDILFAKSNQYRILRLKQSKTDVDHKGVPIILEAIDKQTYSVLALKRPFV